MKLYEIEIIAPSPHQGLTFRLNEEMLERIISMLKNPNIIFSTFSDGDGDGTMTILTHDFLKQSVIKYREIVVNE